MIKPKAKLSDLLNDILTIASGRDWCFAKVLGLSGFIIGNFMTIYNTIALHLPFIARDYWFGIGGLIAGVGGGIMMKKNDEPGNQENK